MMNTNLLDLSNDIFNVIRDYVKKDNAENMHKNIQFTMKNMRNMSENMTWNMQNMTENMTKKKYLKAISYMQNSAGSIFCIFVISVIYLQCLTILHSPLC